MKQDVLHIRDVVSITFRVDNDRGMMALTSDFDDDWFIIPTSNLEFVEDLFNFAYSKADGFEETDDGVTLNIHGDEFSQETTDRYFELWRSLRIGWR